VKSRLYDHIDLRVRDVERAKKFYKPLMNALGFTVDSSGVKWTTYDAPPKGGIPGEMFGFIHDPNHKPNETRIAFWADSREEVDRVAEIARAAGAKNIEGPEPYTPNYYAVFFDDPEGNKLEICYRTTE
jgi:predicted lactoylglutathione lyase